MARENLARKSSRYLAHRLRERMRRLRKAQARVSVLEAEADQLRSAMDRAIARETPPQEAGLDNDNLI